MADEGLSKAEINSIFKRLKSIPSNRQCFDCGANNPTWASVTYGVFVCIDCSAVHRSLGVHITFIRSTQLDTSWTWLQLRAMQVGGNAAANAFFHQHGSSSTDAQQKYNSRAAQMYRERLHSLALKALKQHGKKLHIDGGHGEVHSPTIKESVDFFSKEENEYSNDTMLTGSLSVSEPMPINNGRANPVTEQAFDGIGPNVDAALSMSPSTAIQQLEGVKSTIATRKPAAAKKGLGAKKGGLGAQKVTTSFTEIESAALKKEKDTAAAAAIQPLPAQTGKQNITSLNLAYSELTVEDKKRAEKMKNMDPKKQEQAERLGMGAAGSRGISHSALSDMQSINQETPTNQSRSNLDRYNSRGNRDRDFDDNFDMIRGPPRYDNSFALKSDDSGSRLGRSESNSSWDIIDDKQSGNVEDISVSTKESTDDKGRSRKAHEVSDSTEAQKKFGNAKAISSEQYFGGGRDADFEMRQNLSKFEGSSSISSADLFGGGSNKPSSHSSSSYYSNTGSELADIKEGVRQGVTKVAGRLSSLASGVMNSIQNN